MYVIVVRIYEIMDHCTVATGSSSRVTCSIKKILHLTLHYKDWAQDKARIRTIFIDNRFNTE